MVWLKAVLVLVLIVLAETTQGALRVRFLNRPLGDRRARQLGVLSGSVTILIIVWLTVPWIGMTSIAQALAIGAFWLLAMLAFDLGFGLVIFRFPLVRILREFDPRQGGFLGFGMLVLFLAPLAVAWARGLL